MTPGTNAAIASAGVDDDIDDVVLNFRHGFYTALHTSFHPSPTLMFFTGTRFSQPHHQQTQEDTRLEYWWKMKLFKHDMRQAFKPIENGQI